MDTLSKYANHENKAYVISLLRAVKHVFIFFYATPMIDRIMFTSRMYVHMYVASRYSPAFAQSAERELKSSYLQQVEHCLHIQLLEI